MQAPVQQNPYPQAQYPQTTFVVIFVIIYYSVSASSPQASSYGHSDRTLWIGNLHQDVTEIDLRQSFEKFGNIENVKVFF
jgi:RNA recognition motif-containing protein